ncbi:MAG: response regulator [Candidatus Binatia bacterium]
MRGSIVAVKHSDLSIRISTKLISLTLAGVLGSIAILGWLAVDNGTNALLMQQTRALEAVRTSRQSYVRNYFDIIREQIVNFARDEMIVEATMAFARAFREVSRQTGLATGPGTPAHLELERYYDLEYRPRLEAAGGSWRGTDGYIPVLPEARILQTLYISGNPNPVGRKHLLDTADSGSDYDGVHARFHPLIRGFLDSFGYYDIFLFDLEGNLVYSVFKEADYATNVVDGPYEATNFAGVYRAALQVAVGETVMQDFAPYDPSYGAPASFIGAPVFHGGERVGVAVFQMPVDEINEIMTNVAGLGDSGETYLVGADGRMRSNSRFAEESTILAQQVDTMAARRALAGESGTLVLLDYRGIDVLSSFGPLDLPGLDWAILAEIDMAEVTAPAAALRNRILVIGAFLALGIGLITLFFLRRAILAPLGRLSRGAQAVERGDYSARVEVVSADELGSLAATFNHMTASIAADVDRREREQAELQAAREAADAANQAKSGFLANMSHELRTPMNAIIGYSEMLMEEAEDLSPEEFVPDLAKIHAAGKHLLALINGVLDLSKIEAGRMELYLESFDVGTMLDDVEATVQALVTKKNNRWVLERGDGLGTMRADLTKLRQTLFNLVSNSAKFTENGTLTLAVRRIGAPGGDRFRFSMRDTGIGIAPDKLGSIFEEFTQEDASTTRKFGGTGLGLAITKRFCVMMGGDVTVESELGVGSTFTIDLPAEVVDPVAVEEAARRDARLGVTSPGRCILVIDDDPNARDLMARALERDGFEVATAASGDEGLDAARRLHPTAITLDVMMPGKDGWTVLQELQADAELRDIPVVMVSMIDDKSMGYALGATDYLTKPVDREQLLRALDRYRCPEGPCDVLVVEDEEEIRTLMRRTLQKVGWNVHEAVNGAEGLERVLEGRPDLILLDLMMPVMDGFQFLRELRAVAEWRDIPVIVVTAKDLTEEDRRRLNGAVTAVLEKGAYGREELLAQVRELVVACGRGAPPGDGVP